MRLIARILLLVLFLLFYPYFYLSLHEVGKILGYVKLSVPVAGTGSMYPSFYWQKTEGGPEDLERDLIYSFRTNPHMYKFIPSRRIIHRGDIVAFRNKKTQKLLHENNKDSSGGFIKRVIALPGDTIEIRDGFVFLNNQLLSEPYLYKPRSTYGGSFLPDCKPLKIPSGFIFVLGDNRKVSLDSRGELGLVKISDITYILPFAEQHPYRSLWRDATNDAQFAHKPTLDQKTFITLLNQKRKAQNLSSLFPNHKLNLSAKIKAESILANSPKTLKQAIQETGYHNIILGEFIVHGFYTAEELIQGLQANPKLKTQLYDSRFNEIGISAVLVDKNHCPTQVIVGHLGGYVPPNYDKKTVLSWKKLLDNLNQVIPSWEEARQYDTVDQDKLNQLLNLLYERRKIAQEIYTTLSQNRWLTEEQQSKIKHDQTLSKQVAKLIKELNSQ